MNSLLEKIYACSLCSAVLPNVPKPIVSVSSESKILIIGQAPGQKAHNSGLPWDDASGEALRRWLNVDKNQFYDTSIFGIMPMGFCYPGRGKSGDLPPRRECSQQWHEQMRDMMPNVRLTLLIGKYAQDHYLKGRSYSTLTDNVFHYREFLPEFLPLVHPSPRNGIWQRRNPLFEEEVIPELREIVRSAIFSH